MVASFPALSESDMLKQVKEWALRPRVMKGIIKGEARHKCLIGDVTIVDRRNNDRRLDRLMDDLYNVYRLDKNTTNGMGMLPIIEALTSNIGSEFTIYATADGIVKGFFMSFLAEYQNAKTPIPEMTFVWVVPKFRRQGVFTRMYQDLVARRGPIHVDQPNEACEIALSALGYDRGAVLDRFIKVESDKTASPHPG